MEKKKKKVVQLFARITESFLHNALPAFTIPGIFYYKKEPLNNVSSYEKECQRFNKGCCQYDLIKKEMTGLFDCSRKLNDSKR